MAADYYDYLYESVCRLINEYGNKYKEVFDNSDWKNPFRELVSNDIPDALEKCLTLDENYFIRGSYGKGRWTTVPWVAIIDKRITSSAQKGVYIVLLLNKDTKELYLTLNQGATSVGQEEKNQSKLSFTGIAGASSKKSLDKLRANAKTIKERLDKPAFSAFSDSSDSGSPGYDAGAIFCKKYSLDNLRSGKQLVDDLQVMIEIYKNYYDMFNSEKNSNTDGNSPYAECKNIIGLIKNYIKQKGFIYEDDVIENLYLSLKSKPFVLLAGTSGTGKTRLVRLFAEAIGAHFQMVPVRPDWSDSSDLFGYVDLNGNFVKGAVIDFVKEAQDNPSRPFILCLDEMNLARVEYYLSDLLSVIETRDFDGNKIVTDPLVSLNVYKTDKKAKDHYGTIMFPENLYLIGTVNMDETTFPFSRKVLDRANTIEFNAVDLVPQFTKPKDNKAIVVDNDFLKTDYLILNDCSDKEFVISICKKLNSINELLKQADSQIGYRIRDEIVFYMLNNKNAGNLLTTDEALDNCLMQKILPRIQGNSVALKDLLILLFKEFLINDVSIKNSDDMYELLADRDKFVYPKSAGKVAFMLKRLEEDGFTSYWL